MEKSENIKRSWQGISSFEEAKQLIDYGILLKWREMRTLKRNFSQKQQCDIIMHFTKRLCERAEDRLSAEIVIESLLIWLANSNSEEFVGAFLDQMFEEPSIAQACKTLVEVSLTTEVIDNSHDDQLFSTAVVLICELGIAIFEHEKRRPGEFPKAKAILKNIESYLLSVSNYNSASIRLSLLHYFGVTTITKIPGSSFSKIMNRFGHTVLDHLFSLLFNKRSEAIALQYLIENIGFVLESDIQSQRTLHETFKYYMLKNPERFALFAKTISEHLISEGDVSINARKVYLQHLGSLVNIVSEFNHTELAKDLLITISFFKDDVYRNELMDQIAQESSIRDSIKVLLSQIRAAKSIEELEGKIAKFGSSKRGRKPSFARVKSIATMDQVYYLGNLEAS